MSWKAKSGIVLGCLAVISASIIVVCFARRRHRRRVEWWLDHYYPIDTNLIHQRHKYYSSYREWSRAGQAIPGADRILVEMYRETDGTFERKVLLYAMGAVPTATTVEFISQVSRSSQGEELREWAFVYGLLYNAGMEMVQRALLGHVKDSAQTVGIRCRALMALMDKESKDAIVYARQHGEELLLQARAGGVHTRLTEELEKMLSSIVPASHTAPR